MEEVTAEARMIVRALDLMEGQEAKEQWLTVYLQARDQRVHHRTRRTFSKTDLGSLIGTGQDSSSS